jgi:hypothetical protein
MKHTPGPWNFYKTPWGAKVTDVQDVTVADVPQQPLDTWKAIDNARLIAAAPELLAALRGLVQWEDSGPTTLSDAWEAIAKAEGNDHA